MREATADIVEKVPDFPANHIQMKPAPLPANFLLTTCYSAYILRRFRSNGSRKSRPSSNAGRGSAGRGSPLGFCPSCTLNAPTSTTQEILPLHRPLDGA